MTSQTLFNYCVEYVKLDTCAKFHDHQSNNSKVMVQKSPCQIGLIKVSKYMPRKAARRPEKSHVLHLWDLGTEADILASIHNTKFVIIWHSLSRVNNLQLGINFRPLFHFILILRPSDNSAKRSSQYTVNIR